MASLCSFFPWRGAAAEARAKPQCLTFVLSGILKTDKSHYLAVGLFGGGRHCLIVFPRLLDRPRQEKQIVVVPRNPPL